MKILAIETSCERASVTLRLGSAQSLRRLEGHLNHSERLLPTVRELLAEAGVSLSALDAIAFGSGPGAFTGLRLACGVAQGLAMGAGLGVVPVSSLAALAFESGHRQVLVATDARMGEVYAAAYVCEGDIPEEVFEPICLPPEQLMLPENGHWHLNGSALKAYPERLSALDTERILARDPEAVPSADGVCAIASQLVENGKILAPELAVPLYVRNKVALTTAERFAKGGRA